MEIIKKLTLDVATQQMNDSRELMECEFEVLNNNLLPQFSKN